MKIFLLIIAVAVIGFLFWAIVADRVTQKPKRLKRAERLELEQKRDLINVLLDRAYTERDLGADASPFATIVIDEIRAHERGVRELDS